MKWSYFRVFNHFKFANLQKFHHIRSSCKSVQNSVLSFRNYSNTMPLKILNVAEKNDAARSLAEIMSRGHYRRREGFSKFNKLYEFEYMILGQKCTMVMTSVSGHLLGYKFPMQYKSWNGCSPVTLFDAPVEKYCPDNFIDIKRTLEKEVRGSSKLIIWTDGDREGENIGFEIIDVCTAVKPNIQVYRARFSEITPGAVQRACNNLIAPDVNVSNAVDIRQELDLRIGAAFTRFQTLRLQKVFPNVLADQLISYGSCQFPTLGFVVERYKQVQNFISEPFWKIKVNHQVEEAFVEFNWARNRLFEHLACLVLYQHCLENPSATVTDVKTKSKSKWRPVALDTVEMEKLVSRKMRINAKETMRIAEKLYTQGYISYPRTETNIFPKDLDLRGLVENQLQDPNWGDFAAGLFEAGPTPRNGNKSDNAHPPIHPTKYTNGLQGDEKRIYEFIVRHFLACCSQDAQGMETTVDIHIAEEKFSAHGLVILERNYLDVYPYDKWNAKVIPNFQEGDVFSPTRIEMNQGETSAPPLLTEADLISLMDKHGIGTDATHADHIETIKSRMYVGLQDNKFVPGELGMGLVEGYDAMGYQMSKPNLRAELEADLKRICEGQKDHKAVLADQIAKYKQFFIEACRQANLLDSALAEYFGDAQIYSAPEIQATEEFKPVIKCSRCGKEMILRTKKEGKGYYISCSGFPDCKNAYWLPDFVLEVSVLTERCQQCSSQPYKLKFKFKRGSVPPTMPLEYEGCIGGCDDDLIEILSLNKHQIGASHIIQRPTNRSQPQNRQNPQTGNNRQNSNNNSRGKTTSNNRNVTNVAPNRNPVQRQPLRPINTDEPGSGATPPGGDGAIVCNCGQDAVLRTVRKEGPNQGRQFYACNKPREGGSCQFFLWADAPPDNEVSNNSRSSSFTSGNNQSNYRNSYNNTGSNTDNGDVKCKCGQPAKSLTVQKEGPNKGRPFYGCPKPREQSCGFFQWGDEPISGNTASAGSGGSGVFGGRGVKRKSGENGSGKVRRKSPTCGICGQEGHTRRTCKNQ